MKPENAIEVKNVTKSFKVFVDRGNTIKERALFSRRRRYEYRQVLKGISFEVKKGEAIGLIGQNGCGKSTTLKLLTKIIYPNFGSIEIQGRVSSLIELGAGFHPDLSGRENIYINASIFGLSKKEIENRMDDIIAFSELEEFIDNPVRTYSSGMYMRLAFSVAINVDADVLLIDEILAVGDANFQAKCFNKLREIKAQGTTIVIVSHSLSQIEQICERSIWIHEGVIREEGSPRIIDPIYMEYMSQKNELHRKKEIEHKQEQNINEQDSETEDDVSGQQKVDENKENANEEETSSQDTASSKSNRWGSGEVVMQDVYTLDEKGNLRQVFVNDEKIYIRMNYLAKEKKEDVVFGVAIYRSDQTYIYGTNTLIDYSKPFILEGEGYVDLIIDRLSVNAGEYSIDLAFHRPDGFNYDFWRDACRIILQNRRNEVGIISLSHEWEVVKEK